MKKIILPLCLILLAPAVSQAAWWNPASWFQSNVHQNEEQQKLINRINELELKMGEKNHTQESIQITSTSSETLANHIEREKIAPAQPPVVVKGLDSELQKKIASLISENEQLKTKLASIQTQFSSTQNDLLACRLLVSQKNAGPTKTESDQNKAQSEQNIRIKMAEMDQLDIQIDTLATGTAISPLETAIKNAKDIYGDPLFKDVSIYNLPSRLVLHAIVANYRAALNVELQKYK